MENLSIELSIKDVEHFQTLLEQLKIALAALEKYSWVETGAHFHAQDYADDAIAQITENLKAIGLEVTFEKDSVPEDHENAS